MFRLGLFGLMFLFINFSTARADCLLVSKGETRKEGTIVYNKKHDVLQTCLGQKWRALGRIKPVERPTCNPANLLPGCLREDGTIYAWLTPDGERPMFVTRCDYGQSWNVNKCEGTRLPRPWNDGSQTATTVQTGITDFSTGAANTQALAVMDSNNELEGIQPFMAAKACAELNIHGHNDWYLPAADEMLKIYDAKDEIGDFLPGFYFTSTQGIGNTGRVVHMDDGSINQSLRYLLRNIRCARKE